MTDLLLACLHHLVVFALVTIPAVELALLRGSVGALRVAHLARIDAAYGILAALILVIGYGRVVHGAKGPDFYLHNPVFWAKLVFFALSGLASAVPTVRLLRWKKAELALFVPIPLLAAAMARGVGLS